MQIVNIFVAIILALGFWKESRKKQDLKTAKSSFTKTFILFILTVGVTFFYYKTYQIATFYNYITVRHLKGSFDTYIDHGTYANGETYEIKRYVPRDKIASLTIFSSFSDENLNFFDPRRDQTHDRKQSGFIVKMNLDKNPKSEVDSSNVYDEFRPTNIDKLKYCYDVSLMTNTVPSLFPFSVYEESFNKDIFMDKDDPTVFLSSARSLKHSSDVFGDYDKLYCLRLASDRIEEKAEESLFSDIINTLNFFSAADLSQCQYMFVIRSSVPVDDFNVCFDVPIEVSSAGIKQNKLDSRDFSVDIEEKEDGTVDKFALYHVKFPTLSNLQLIRSLILTTLLTALVSLFLTNLYYWCRKLYKAYLKRHESSYKMKKLLLLLWIPTGKIIVWSFMLLISVGLFLSITGVSIRLDAGYILLYKIVFFFCITIYIIFVCLLFYMLHKRKIYAKDIELKLLSCYERFKLTVKSIKKETVKKMRKKIN